MIIFNYETNFSLEDETKFSDWLISVIRNEGFSLKEINYIFCSDDYLHEINVNYLRHDTLTDIISFDYSIGKNLQGDVFISVERVEENAKKYSPDFINELARVMVHGMLHFCGHEDKTEAQKQLMRAKEDEYLKSLFVKS